MTEQKIHELYLAHDKAELLVRVLVPKHTEGETFSVVYLSDREDAPDEQSLREAAEKHRKGGKPVIAVQVCGTADMGSKEYDDLIANVVRPEIEKRFPTDTGRTGAVTKTKDGRRAKTSRVNTVRRSSLKAPTAVALLCALLVGSLGIGTAGVFSNADGSKDKSADAEKENVASGSSINTLIENGTETDTDTKISALSDEKDEKTADKKQSKPATTPSGKIIPEEYIPEITMKHELTEVLVGFSEGYTADQITSAIEQSGCTLPQAITKEDLNNGFATLKISGDYDVEHAMAQLDLLPELSLAQPNYEYKLIDECSASEAGSMGSGIDTSIINDPLKDQQWALESVNAYEAWETTKTDGAVTVAVLDQGVDLTHEDIVNNVYRENGQIVQYNAYDDCETVVPGEHGTHVAGIISAEANNGKGIAGVSHNAKLISVEALDPVTASGYTSQIVRGFRWIIDYAKAHPEANIRVVNMSLGLQLDDTDREDIFLTDTEMLLIQLIREAYDNGILTVVSAGNGLDNNNRKAYLSWPEDWNDCTLSVIALDKPEQGLDPYRAYYSNYDRPRDTVKMISAPGTNILSTFYGDYLSSDEYGKGAYRNMSGTSMAAPYVSGIAALLFAANPDLDAETAKEILCNTARKIHSDTSEYINGTSLDYGYGEIDAAAAVKADSCYINGTFDILAGDATELSIIQGSSTSDPSGWEWSSSDETIATVSGGTVTGIAGGKAVITASKDGETLTKEITVYEASFSSIPTMDFFMTGETTFEAYPESGSWLISVDPESTGNADIITKIVYGNRKVKILPSIIGSVKLTATLVSNPEITVTSDEFSILPADLSSASLDEIDNQAYTGEPITLDLQPSFTFENPYNPEESNIVLLFEGDDFTASYENNVDVGTATVTLTGCGNFTGETSLTFNILDNSLTGVDISLSQDSFVFDETEHCPDVEVTLNGSELTAGTDYRVEYINNYDAGTAYVQVIGMNGFAGTVYKEFTIEPADISTMTIAGVANQPYTGKEQTPTVTLLYGEKQYVSNKTTNITAEYKDNIEPGVAAIELTGVNNFKGTATAEFRISDKVITIDDISIETPEGGFVYNGQPQKPTVTITYNGTPLTPNIDYVTYYDNNIFAGKGTILILPIGEYVGEKKDGSIWWNYFYFDIVRADISAADISDIDAQTFTGVEIKPEPVVKFGDQELERGMDYELAYENNINAAEADADNPPAVIVMGKGNFSGSVKKTFTIEPADISTVIIAEITDQTYTGSAIEPKPEIKFGDIVLTEGTDYTFSYENNINVGGSADANAPTVTVNGTGNFTGTASVTFTITPADISAAEIAQIDAQTYTGEAIEPKPEIKFNDIVLTEGTDYTLSYENNIDAAKSSSENAPTVVITGTGNFTGTTNAKFTIEPEIIAATTIAIEDMTFTGTAVEPKPVVKLGDVVLTEGTDYTLSYENNIDAADADSANAPTVIITGKGSLSGTIRESFTIKPADISTAIIEKIEDQTYSADGSEPKPVVKLGEIVLTEGQDYTISYENNTNVPAADAANKPTVIVTGTGNLVGTNSANFNILPKQVSELNVTLEKRVYVYDGTEHKPRATVKDGNKVLVEGTDYTLEYFDNIEKGAAAVTVKGIGNYTGVVSRGFAIKDTDELIIGDVNDDGKVDTSDLALLQQYLAGWNVDIDLLAADVTCDNKVNAEDVVRLQQYFAGWNVTLGA